MVLAGCQRKNVSPTDDGNKTRFLAFEKFLHDDALTGGTELIPGEHLIRRPTRLFQAVGDDHTFTSREAVRFHHQRWFLFGDIGFGRGRIGETLVGGGGNAVTHQEVLGKSLGTLELGGARVRAEYGEPAALETINHARHQRRLGPDDGEIHPPLEGEI